MTTAAAIETWNIPAELKALRRWVVWRGVWKITKEGKRKLDKPPYQVNGDPASHTDPSTWTTFEKAAACAEEHGLTGTKGGIGFVFTDDDPYVGVDLDGCVVNGECLPEAITIIKRLGGYAELSVSGTGWHILLRARKPSKRCTVARKWNGKFKGKIEVFEKERFFTFTGSIHELSQDPIPERQEAFTAWYREVFPESGNGAKASGTGSTALLTDDEVLALLRRASNASKFEALWSGDTKAYDGDESRATAALLCLLVFYTRDRAQLDRLFRASGLMREKWNERRGDSTWGAEEIRTALERVTESYSLRGKTAAVEEEEIADAPRLWPAPLDPRAYHGLAGKVVLAIEPHSEADPIALLDQFLTCYGNAIGRKAQYRVEDTLHFTNLDGVIVGATSKGRKGTSADRVLALFEHADENWRKEHVRMGGLSSGEGLIWEVRDPIIVTENVAKKGQPPRLEEAIKDPGVNDKRLLVIESEFANVLKVAKREGNTLTVVIRNSWDGGDLRTMTKNNPARATGAHISIIGHITDTELRRHLEETEMANGFANRFIWVCARRSKFLPDGGGALEKAKLTELQDELRKAVEFGKKHHELKRDDEAKAVWHAVYPILSDGKPGLFGALVARGEAQVLRLSMIYALLDCSAVIRVEHVMAALALWEYVERSVRFIFGDSLGDVLADDILRALRANPEGLTRTDIRDLFQRHQGGGVIARSLGLLLRYGVARREEAAPGKAGCALRRSWTAVSRESGQPVQLKLDTHQGAGLPQCWRS